jgi:hypothetical protein
MASVRKRAPALILFFLSPAVGELLSGSSPPAEFFRPLTLLLLGALYGGGALLIRELKIRWRKGWPTVLLLGAAYGLIEEGLMVKSFFDPNWVDLGPLASYGRWAGVNWVWALELTLFHAVFSISVPIFLAEHLFPDRSREPWIGRRTAIMLAVLFVGDVLLGLFALTPYRPPLIPYALTILCVLALTWIAHHLPVHWFGSKPRDPESIGLFRFRMVGFLGTLALFALSWIVPTTRVPAWLNLWSLTALAAAVFVAIAAVSRGGAALGDRQSLAMVSGAIGFFVLLAPLQELSPGRTDDPSGMTLVGALFLLLLIGLEWRFRGAASPAPAQFANPPRG